VRRHARRTLKPSKEMRRTGATPEAVVLAAALGGGGGETGSAAAPGPAEEERRVNANISREAADNGIMRRCEGTREGVARHQVLRLKRCFDAFCADPEGDSCDPPQDLRSSLDWTIGVESRAPLPRHTHAPDIMWRCMTWHCMTWRV
jgi:hypothetical protein